VFSWIFRDWYSQQHERKTNGKNGRGAREHEEKNNKVKTNARIVGMNTRKIIYISPLRWRHRRWSTRGKEEGTGGKEVKEGVAASSSKLGLRFGQKIKIKIRIR
jgi:hypothetical protein